MQDSYESLKWYERLDEYITGVFSPHYTVPAIIYTADYYDNALTLWRKHNTMDYTAISDWFAD